MARLVQIEYLKYKCIALIGFIATISNVKAEGNTTDFIGAYYSLDEVKAALASIQENTQDKWAGDKMMTTFDNFISTLPAANITVRKYPFFVIEGNHRIRKYVVARNLAKHIYAANLVNPPDFLASYKTCFNTVSSRRAFYSLSHYANSNYARVLLERRPVVTAGYWLDIAAFTLAKKYPVEFPPWGSKEMKWPEDLLEPDLIFYINTPLVNKMRGGTTREPNPLRPRLIQFYQHWQHPRVVEINHMYANNEMFDEIFRHVNYIKHLKYPDAVKYYNRHK